MRIVVCVKRVGRMIHPAAVDLATGRPDPERMVFMLNPEDEVAVEAALRLREAIPDCSVTLLTAGSADAEEALRRAGAMGGRLIDSMVRIDFEPADAWTAAVALAAALRGLGFDLVLCGRRAADTNSGQVGSFIAELLDLPQVSGVVKLDLRSGAPPLVVERSLGRGDREEVECSLPALLTVDVALNEPRYPTFPDRICAERASIDRVEPTTLITGTTETLVEFGKLTPPRPRTRKAFTTDTGLSVADRMSQMVTGGAIRKEGGAVLEETPDEAARQIVAFLVEHGFVPGRR